MHTQTCHNDSSTPAPESELKSPPLGEQMVRELEWFLHVELSRPHPGRRIQFLHSPQSRSKDKSC